MRVPSLKPGTHTFKLTVDTKTPFGILTGERSVIIEDPSIAKLQNEYASARAQGNTARAAAISRQLIARRFSHSIKPGRPIPIDKPITSDEEPSGKVKGAATWYPGKDQLRVLIDVTDPRYVALRGKGGKQYLASVLLFVCPTGADADICEIYTAHGDNGTALWGVMGRRSYPKMDQVKAVWKNTAKGYRAELSIPWSVIKDLPANWTALPVEVMIVGDESDRNLDMLRMSPSGNPNTSARGYCLLTRK